jgi:hypothetical protein
MVPVVMASMPGHPLTERFARDAIAAGENLSSDHSTIDGQVHGPYGDSNRFEQGMVRQPVLRRHAVAGGRRSLGGSTRSAHQYITCTCVETASRPRGNSIATEGLPVVAGASVRR